MRIVNLKMQLNIVWIIVAVLLATQAASAGETPTAAEPITMPVELFFKEMQLLARRVPVGNTKLDQEDSLAKLREEIHVKFDGVILEYKVRIASIDWRNDVVSIKTQSPIRKYKPSARMPFNISTTQPLAIPMSRDEAGSLQTRKLLVFRGTLTFLDGKWGAVGRPPKSQAVFWIRSEYYKTVQSIGTFITEDYSIAIGDDEVFALRVEEEAE